MLFRRPRVDYEAAFIEVIDGREAVRIVNRRREGMHAVLCAFTGNAGYDGLSWGVWEALDDASEAKAEIAKNWLWHLLHSGTVTLKEIREGA